MYSNEKLTIETPEQIPLEYLLAGIGSRFLALLVDSLLQFIAYMLLLFLAVYTLGDISQYWPKAWSWTAAIYVILFFLLYWGYYAAWEGLWRGQTPGKRYAGIRVIKDTGRPITIFESFARNLMRAIDQLPGIYAVGVITMFFNDSNRRLGDFVAGTVVVHESKSEQLTPDWESAKKTGDAPFIDLEKLGPQDLQLIDTFLQRRLDLSEEIRRSTAKRIADRISQKITNTARPEGVSDETYLETVARALRDTARYRNATMGS